MDRSIATFQIRESCPVSPLSSPNIASSLRTYIQKQLAKDGPVALIETYLDYSLRNLASDEGKGKNTIDTTRG